MKRLYIALLLQILALTHITLAESSSLSALPLSTQQIETLRSVQTDDIENAQLTWKGNPLTILLPVGQEKRVIFPESIEVDVNGTLTTEQLRIINNDKSLYLAAQKVFPKTRIYVTLKTSRQIVLLDLLTVDHGTASTQKIILPDKKTNNSSELAEAKPQINLAGSRIEDKVIAADAYVNAIRFAWQQLYAPQRLLNTDVGFERTPMRSEFWVSSLIYGDKVLAHPQASWQLDGLYVTVVELRNKYPHATSLNLSRDLCGEWQAVTLYPRHYLKPAGEKLGDTTILFLISSKPFSSALGVCHGSA